MAAAAARKKKLDLLETGELDEDEKEVDDQQKEKKDTKLTEESAQRGGIDWGMGESLNFYCYSMIFFFL